MFSEFIRNSGQNRSAWADRLEVSRSYLSDLLNGHKTPSLELAARIERATGGAVPASSWIPDPAAASTDDREAAA